MGGFLFPPLLLGLPSLDAVNRDSTASFAAMATGEYDSNVLRLPETSASAPGGAEDFSNMLFLWTDLPVGPPSSRVSFRLFAFSNDYSKLHDLDMVGLSGGVHWKPAPRAGLAEFETSYDLQRLLLDRRAFLDTHILKARLKPGPPAASVRLGADYALRFKAFAQGALQDFNAQQHDWAVRLAFGGWEPSAQVTWLRAARRDATYFGAETRCRWTVRLPRGAALSLMPSFRYRGHLAPDAPDSRRVDRRVAAEAQLRRNLASRLSLEIEGRWEDQRSTLAAFQYRKTAVGLSLMTWF